MRTIAERHTILHHRLKQERKDEAMSLIVTKPRHQLLDEIASFRPWRGPALAPGVAGFLHKPVLQRRYQANNNSWGMRECVACMCGGCHPVKNSLEEELNAVVFHIVEEQVKAERKLESMVEEWRDAESNTR